MDSQPKKSTAQKTSVPLKADNGQSSIVTKQHLFIAAILVFVVFVGSFSGYLFATSVFGAGIAKGSDSGDVALDKKGIGSIFSSQKQDNIERILLIGVDKANGGVSRADTIILAIVNTTKSEVNLLSIPRDTRTQIPGRGFEKINHANAYGGPELLCKTVSNLLGIDVDSYVSLNFAGFSEVINILDGVDYNVEMRMYNADENINLHPGQQHLNGNKALQYVRYRSDGRGDIGRVERQQKFLFALLDQSLKLKNLTKIPELVGEAYRSVKTNIGLKDMITIAMAMKDMQSEDLTAAILPGEPQYIGGVSYWISQGKTLKEIFPEKQATQQTTESDESLETK